MVVILGRGAAFLLLLSLAFPYWQAQVFAPQYPGGLKALMYVYRVGGDAHEVDGLNHYIGVSKLGALARVERMISIPSVVILAGLCLVIPRIRRRSTRCLLTAVVIAYPMVFIGDMAFWMRYASTHLNPTAPLKIKPFIIPVWGTGHIAQFRSEVGPHIGFFLVVAAIALLLVALYTGRDKSTESKESGTARLPSAHVARDALWFILLGLWAWPSQAASLPLQDQINQAVPGAVIDLPAGSYQAPLVIDKPVTLRGGGSATLDGKGQGTVVTVHAPGVVLDGLHIRGSGESLLFEDSGIRVEAAGVHIQNCVIEDVLFGVFLAQAPDAFLEGNTIQGKPIDLGRRGDLIRLWYSDRPVMRRNHLIAGRDTVLWYSNGSVFEGNRVEGGRYGLHFMYTNQARVADNAFVNNSVGAYVMYSKGVSFERNRFESNRGPSGAGLGLKESNVIFVEDNAFIHNRQGVFIDQSPTVPEETNRFHKNLIGFNDVGMAMLPGVQGNIFTENSFNDNLEQVSIRGGGQLHGNFWAENGRGNYWSDYAGYGLKGALIGRIAYRAENSFESLMDHFPFTRFFAFTPASQAVEMAGRAFPIFRPKPKLVDPAPLLRPSVSLPAPFAVPKSSATLLPIFLAVFPVAWLGWFFRKKSSASVTPARITIQSSQAPLAIEIRSLSKSFNGRAVIKDLSLMIAPGQTLVLWGANGAGKSTLLKALLGLHVVEGEIMLFGCDIRKEGHIARKQIGYLPQEFTWYDWTVHEAMEFICRMRGISLERIGQALHRCHLEGEESKDVRALSGGMKQKLALAQALVAEPDLLLLDEPCSNLDLKSRHEMLEILKHLKGSHTVLLTSHHLEEVEALADEVVWMEDGKPARRLDLDAFYRALGSDLPLWIRLEEKSFCGQAMALLRDKGFHVSPDGEGLFVQIEPRRKMQVVRLLETAGLAVRDIRQEMGS